MVSIKTEGASMRRRYPTDLTDKEWELIERYFEREYPKGGRPLKHSRREILNAIFFILRTGCQWRNLPHDFPHWKTVHEQFRRWKKVGLFENINLELTKKFRINLKKMNAPVSVL